MVRTMEVVTALLAIAAGSGAVLLVAARFLAPSIPLAARWGAAVAGMRAQLTFAVGAVSMLGSLYFSEIADFIPCRLCWYQRIAMYPIAVVALVALIRRDRSARWYFLPMATIGAAISLYHYLIEWGVLHDSDSCALFGPACADVWFRTFGFATLAFMALAGFIAVIVINTVSFDRLQLDPAQEVS